MFELLKKKYSVTGIGNAIIDIVANVEDNFIKNHNLDKGSMKIITENEAHLLNEQISAVKMISGGSAANTVAGLAMLGHNVAFIGKVKNDALGKAFESELKSIGVTFITRKAKSNISSTARCIVLSTPDAQRTMVTCLGIAGSLGPEDIDEKIITNSSIIYLEGYLWDKDDAKKAILKAIKLAKNNGSRVAFSLSDSFCVIRHKDEFLNLINNRINILFANELEIMTLFDTDNFDSAIDKCKKLKVLVVITRSEKGSIIIFENETIFVKAQITKVMDSTGAGDLFAAGFLNGLIKGMDLCSCGKMGSIIASEAISHYGARPELPLTDLLKEKGF
ncbi:MAG: adenosine kinase [Actinobacteria bacterium]|nr:adenosine kinase [Actinomycetota bacterium]MCL5070264.1 adenosine kinase [Actinomycetota bacterium]